MKLIFDKPGLFTDVTMDDMYGKTIDSYSCSLELKIDTDIIFEKNDKIMSIHINHNKQSIIVMRE